MKPHYTKIRKVKTHSGSIAIQVGYYQGKRFILQKHIGSAKSLAKIDELIEMGRAFIKSHSPQLELNFNPQSEEIMFKRGMSVTYSKLEIAYAYLDRIYTTLGLSVLDNELLKHFCLIRVLEPASKLKSIELLDKYFGIKYKKTSVFRELGKLTTYKEKVINAIIAYAKTHLNFNFSLVFYDVTTLYFETFKSDVLRSNGFSKDNKINQPQILIGLVVGTDGFPIYYDIFKGNTFEGNTIIPVITQIKDRYDIARLTVVADAGMLSAANLAKLEELEIKYIVGARLGKLTLSQVKFIATQLNQINKQAVTIGDTLYEYSTARATKDRADHDKQLNKALYLMHNPSKVLKRSQYLVNKGKKSFSLDEERIEKHRLLEGVKGYRTNVTDVSPSLLINRYHDLWKIEQAFRIAKSDLEARPIYHRKQDSIEYHILIVFIALCMVRVIEKESGQSITKIVEKLKDEWTITLSDEISGNSIKLNLNHIPH